MDGSEAEGDLVLIQTFPLYYENQVILFSRTISITKQSLYQNKVNLSLTFTPRLGYEVHNSKMAYIFSQ